MSQQKTKILFVINPISGGKKKNNLPDLIARYLDQERYEAEYVFTERVGHASQLTQAAINAAVEVVVAVGGDGTINEVAGQLIGSTCSLAIIPSGSGNGLARFLKIPLKVQKAVALINKAKIIQIDSAVLNGHKFVNMAGVGFDAQLSAVFADNKGRGFSGYLQQGIKVIFGYKAQTYQLEIDGKVQNIKAFAISLANSSQYGNNVYISPKSSLTDGLIDVCIIHPITFFKLLLLSFQMLTKRTDRSSLVTIIRGQQIKISRQTEGPVHLDGEPLNMGKELSINMVPASLRVMVSH